MAVTANKPRAGMTPVQALRHEYGAGFTAGIVATLDALEGRCILAPDGNYRGPVPDELLTWIAQTRRNVEALDS